MIRALYISNINDKEASLSWLARLPDTFVLFFVDFSFSKEARSSAQGKNYLKPVKSHYTTLIYLFVIPIF